ncbi:hypothetical protein BCR44DRAFT_1068838 [Catenaria anguillulae PL171]|uniref:Uncharacterized protein n=1 Tax=Catenaria anguillulae PL171 TaxID=765915 RepID=A0A1Y2HS68_9FUNG|nr:hypothetical protein BCR44DRAFT_1068838 [Catenaria anguillulae PL171]
MSPHCTSRWMLHRHSICPSPTATSHPLHVVACVLFLKHTPISLSSPPQEHHRQQQLDQSQWHSSRAPASNDTRPGTTNDISCSNMSPSKCFPTCGRVSHCCFCPGSISSHDASSAVAPFPSMQSCNSQFRSLDSSLSSNHGIQDSPSRC